MVVSRRSSVQLLTTHDLLELAQRYVPRVALNHHQTGLNDANCWWPAHELGHLLVATPRERRRPMFGLKVVGGIDHDDLIVSEHYAMRLEIAAMNISGRLLRCAGRPDLADEEIQLTDEDTVEWSWSHRGCVRRTLKARRLLRLPRTRSALETMIERRLG